MAIDELRLFSKNIGTSEYQKMLEKSSRSKTDAQIREKVYSDIHKQYADLKEAFRSFSGVGAAEMPLLSLQYINADVAANVRSFAGFLGIEKALAEPTALVQWFNTYNINHDKVMPNIGQDNFGAELIALKESASAPGTWTAAAPIIPGSVKVVVTDGDGKESSYFDQVTEAGQTTGYVLAPAGVLTAGTITYGTGVVTVTPAAGTVKVYAAVKDMPKDENLADTIAIDFEPEWVKVETQPGMLIAKSNLLNIAKAQKSLNVNLANMAGQRLTEMYIKLMNKQMVKAIEDIADDNVSLGMLGNTSTAGGAAFGDGVPGSTSFASVNGGWHDYQSYLDQFQGALVNVDACLANKSAKGLKATAYVVGENVATWFRKLKNNGSFVDNNDANYINDLLGYYQGVPVLRHNDIDANTGYAVHKTADGQMAPIMRGIYMPLTDLPVCGNYKNPSQYTQGVYYQEKSQGICKELVQKFTL